MIPTADRQKATVKVRISFTEPDHKTLRDPALDPRILPDMGVKVTFLNDEAETKAAAKGKSDKPVAVAVIPQGAVHNDNGTKYVLTVQGNSIERRVVTLGDSRGADVEVLAGIAPGATVVVKGPDNLTDGEAVQVKQ